MQTPMQIPNAKLHSGELPSELNGKDKKRKLVTESGLPAHLATDEAADCGAANAPRGAAGSQNRSCHTPNASCHRDAFASQ